MKPAWTKQELGEMIANGTFSDVVPPGMRDNVVRELGCLNDHVIPFVFEETGRKHCRSMLFNENAGMPSFKDDVIAMFNQKAKTHTRYCVPRIYTGDGGWYCEIRDLSGKVILFHKPFVVDIEAKAKKLTKVYFLVEEMPEYKKH